MVSMTIEENDVRKEDYFFAYYFPSIVLHPVDI